MGFKPREEVRKQSNGELKGNTAESASSESMTEPSRFREVVDVVCGSVLFDVILLGTAIFVTIILFCLWAESKGIPSGMPCFDGVVESILNFTAK